MSRISTNQKNAPATIKFDFKKILLTCATAVISMVVLIWGTDISGISLVRSFSIISVWAFFILIFIMMVKTRNTNKFRGIIFFIMSLMFASGFTLNLIHYVNAGLSSSNGDYVRIDDVVLALLHTMNLPGKSNGLLFFVFMSILIWGGAALAFGRGFCSWICPIGGMDDMFSGLTKNPYIKAVDNKWLNLPFAIIIVTALLLMGKVIPTTQCTQNCPSKNILCNAAVPVSSFWGIAAILGLVFIAFAIILPLLTGKRTMCSFICPIGRLQSLLSKIGLIKLAVEKDKCTGCKKCTGLCTSFGMTEFENELMISGLCTKCMKCYENCPFSAVSLKIQDEKIESIYFVYPAFLFMVVFGGRMMANSLYLIMNLIFS